MTPPSTPASSHVVAPNAVNRKIGCGQKTHVAIAVLVGFAVYNLFHIRGMVTKTLADLGGIEMFKLHETMKKDENIGNESFPTIDTSYNSLVVASAKNVSLRKAIQPTTPAPTIAVDVKMNAANQMRSSRNASGADFSAENETHWCIIGNDSMWPGVMGRFWGWKKSVAHSSEALFPCWSWFVENNVTDSCGFAFTDKMFAAPPIAWTKYMKWKMNCKNTDVPRGPNNTIDVGRIPIHKQFKFKEHYWIQSPAAAEALRNLILPGPTDQAMVPGMLNVGIILRDNSRQFRNVTTLLRSLEDNLGRNGTTAVYSLVNPGRMTPFDQAKWFATKHIIIAAHGAALANCIFIQPGTTAIQLYPANYYFYGYFESLVTKSGGINMDWYDGDKSKAKDVHTEMGLNARERAKKAPFMRVVNSEISALAKSAAERYYALGLPRPPTSVA